MDKDNNVEFDMFEDDNLLMHRRDRAHSDTEF